MNKLKDEEDIIKSWHKRNGNPKVSICCTTYNHEAYIEDTLWGFLMQETNFAFEILIHDDASTDDTQEIIEKYEREYPNIVKPIYQIENQYSKGKRINFTYNYLRAKGDYIALCEGDDYWTDKKKLQKQVDILEENKDSMLCIHATGVYRVADDLLVSNDIRPSNINKKFKAEDIILGGGEFGHTSSCVFRSRVIKNPPKWFVDAPSGDTPLRLLCAHIGPIYYLDEEMSIYRRGVKGSWTDRVQSNDKFISHWNRGIQMLKEYNSYTNNKYSTPIKKRISEIAYSIVIRTGRLNNDTKDSDEYYIMLNKKAKFKFQIRMKFPWLFNFYKKLK